MVSFSEIVDSSYESFGRMGPTFYDHPMPWPTVIVCPLPVAGVYSGGALGPDDLIMVSVGIQFTGPLGETVLFQLNANAPDSSDTVICDFTTVSLREEAEEEYRWRSLLGPASAGAGPDCMDLDDEWTLNVLIMAHRGEEGVEMTVRGIRARYLVPAEG